MIARASNSVHRTGLPEPSKASGTEIPGAVGPDVPVDGTFCCSFVSFGYKEYWTLASSNATVICGPNLRDW